MESADINSTEGKEETQSKGGVKNMNLRIIGERSRTRSFLGNTSISGNEKARVPQNYLFGAFRLEVKGLDLFGLRFIPSCLMIWDRFDHFASPV